MLRPALVLAAVFAAAPARAACGTSVVLNELLPDAAGTDAGQEWVELHNAGATEVDVSGWVVERATAPTSWGAVFTLPASTTLAPGAFLVVAGPSTTLPGGIEVVRLEPGAELGNASTSSDGVRLRTTGVCVVDLVVYGPSNAAGQVFENEDGDEVTDDMLAPKPASGKALARVPDGADTNHGDDLVSQTPTPGATNGGSGTDTDTDAGGCVPGVPGGVVLNELLANPEGADGGLEWVELFNPGAAPVDLEGWSIEQAGGPDDWGTRVRYTFLPGATIAAGGWILLAEEAAPVPERANLVTMGPGERLSLGNSEDAVRLVDCEGEAIDEVVYGGSNPDGFVDAVGDPLPDDAIAPAVREGASLARREDGYDTGDHAEDWVTEPLPTPGGANTSRVCRGEAGDVLINELLPDPDGADATADAEWVELIHTGTQGVDLSGWEIAKLTSIGVSGPNVTVLATLPPGTELEPGELLVVGGVFAEEADVFVEGFDLGSGSGGDAVVVIDCEGEVSDTVIYGGENTDGLEEDDGTVPTEGAADPDEDQCVARVEDGADTNTSAVDFKVTSRCTPGASNVLPADTDEDDVPDAGGCGCAGRDGPVRSTPRRDGACSTLPGQAPALALGLVLVGLARRRR